MPSLMGSESVVCELAAAKSMAVQSRRELRVIWFLALGVIATRLIATGRGFDNRVGSLMISRPRAT
jgi:hypothetical protein